MGSYCSLVPRPFPPPVFDRLHASDHKLEAGTAWERHASDHKLEAGTAWERGYGYCTGPGASLVPRPFPAPVLIACMPFPAPVLIACMQAIKTGAGNGLGTRLP